MTTSQDDRRSLFLLLSLLLFILLSPFLEHRQFGAFILVISLYVTLVSALLELHGKTALRWLATLVAIPSMFAMLFGLIFPSRTWEIIDFSLLIFFFGLVSVGLFTYLGRPGEISNARVYASVSLYFILGTFWFALYNLTEASSPGSFLASGASPGTAVPRSAFLYFSLATLTTLGYGDIVPVHPVARMFAVLEAATGVLYIAITVARLVTATARGEPKPS